METYDLSPIKSLSDSLKVRKIRNECRSFMTNDQSEIGILKQISWYLKIYGSKNKTGEITCYLFRSNGQILGYGLIRKVSNKSWITGGLLKSERGKGFGKILFDSLIGEVPSSEVWLEVLASNAPARKIYEELGFKNMEEIQPRGRKIVVMKLTK